MDDKVLRGHKLQAYVLLKVLKYCTGSSATSYKVKFAVQQVFANKEIESMDELGSRIKEIIHYNTIRGKFASVHPDLAAEGITRVDVGEEGLQFIRSNLAGEYKFRLVFIRQFSGKETSLKEISEEEAFNEKEEDDELLKLALEEHSRREEEILARDLESTMLWHV